VPSEKQRADAPRSPEPLTGSHDLTSFDSGVMALNDWLLRRALRNEAAGNSRTYVVCSGTGKRVVAYYCLVAGAVARLGAPGRVRRNAPVPIPVVVIGRLPLISRFKAVA
jgi:hypothetical protein